ncbi:hypothetical protein D3C78_557160 [compost metagenome]
MQQAQGAQRLDQGQLARVEIVELVVAIHQFGQLAQAFMTVAGKHHPQVLDSGAHAAVIEVDNVEDFVAAHHVAWVAVAVQTDGFVRGAGIDGFDPFEQVAGD